MDPEQEKQQQEIELQPPEQELQQQLSTTAFFVAKAGWAVITGGLSKVGEFLWGLIASRVVEGISFGGLHGPGPKKPSASVSFFYKHQTSLLLLCLVVGVVLLPLLIALVSLFSTMSGQVSSPPNQLNQ